jgi:type IV pilus assembly protein PilW
MMQHPQSTSGTGQHQRGYTLIEILVALLIALFLLAGLGTMVAGTRKTSTNQTSLAQLQDEERLAMSMLKNVIQTAGYFDSNPNNAATYTTAISAFPAVTVGSTALAKGQFIGGSHSVSLPDELVVQYQTNGSGDGILNCNGSSNATNVQTFVNYFFIGVGANANQLMCSIDGNASDAVTLVNNVVNMQIWYGVSTPASRTGNTYVNSVDTYMTANQVSAGNWANVISARVTLTFKNPLWGQPGQVQYVTFTRVITVQGGSGPYVNPT